MDIKIELETTLFKVVYKWMSQVWFFHKDTDISERREKYETALRELGSLFNRHHKELSDSHFSRIFRFLREFLDFETNNHEDINNRFDKFMYQEVD